MLSIWTILFILLCTELCLNLILVVPVFQFVRKSIIGALRFVFRNTALQTAAIIVAILLVYSFGFSYYTQTRLTEELNEHGELGTPVIIDATKELSLRVRIFREQRNMYLSGFSFFHGIVLWRLIKLYDQFDEDEKAAKHDVVEKSPKPVKKEVNE